MVKCFCDMCGEEITKLTDLRRMCISNSGGHTYKKRTAEDRFYNWTISNIHLCVGCAEKIIRLLNVQTCEEVEEKSKAEAERNFKKAVESKIEVDAGGWLEKSYEIVDGKSEEENLDRSD